VRVSGIIKDYEGNTDFPYTDFISFSTIGHSFLKNTYRNDQWGFNPAIPRIQAFVKHSENTDPRQAAALFNAVWQRHNTAGSFERFLKFNMVLQPLSDIHFNEGYDNDGIRKAHRPALYGLIAVAVFILLLAIVNFINLSTAQSLQQAKDIGIRRILGASHFRLILRSLTETAILTTLSAIIALALVHPVMTLFRDYIPEGIPFNPLTGANLLFAAESIIVTTLLAGLYPAISLVRLRLNRSVQTQKFILRRILIVFQFSISLLFIIACLVVGRQINFMLDTDMGFNSTAVVTVTGFNAPPQQLRLFARQALAIPGVQASNFHTTSLHTPIPALVIARLVDQDNSVGLRITLSNRKTLPRLEALWKNLFHDQPFTYTFFDDSIAQLYKKDQQLSWLVRISTAVTIFVSCIGLLGLILFIVERKKKEISIRKVLGAGVADIVFLLNKEFMVLVGIALVIASPIALLGMRRWLQGFAYRINISWWVFVLAGIITLTITLLTISLRVIRAALINPTDNIRSE
jgi:hypothetical protein